MHTWHFHRQVAWNCSREACDALTCLLKDHSLAIQDPQLRVYKDPQRLGRETTDLLRCWRTLLQHLLWVFQGQDTEWHANLRRTQSHTVKFTHYFHHSVDDLLDLVALYSCRINSSCVWTQHWVSYLAHMTVRRTGWRYDLVFHVLKIGAHLDVTGVRVTAVTRWMRWEIRIQCSSSASWHFGCTESECQSRELEQRHTWFCGHVEVAAGMTLHNSEGWSNAAGKIIKKTVNVLWRPTITFQVV